MEADMTIRNFVVLLAIALVAWLPVHAQSGQCEAVGGVLMTNIGAITDGAINLGPVYGDLAGSVAAKIVSANGDGTFTLQHYWVTAAGDTILFKTAVLHPAYPVAQATIVNQAVVAVPWGSYTSDISGGTGKFDGATGTLSYFGMADFIKNTLVLRYSGKVCFKQQ
jgi:hypothetical protein